MASPACDFPSRANRMKPTQGTGTRSDQDLTRFNGFGTVSPDGNPGRVSNAAQPNADELLMITQHFLLSTILYGKLPGQRLY
jgi:hypothetical protein